MTQGEPARYVYQPASPDPLAQARTSDPPPPSRGLRLPAVVVVALALGLGSGALAAVITLEVDQRTNVGPDVAVDLQPASGGRAPSSAITEIADTVIPTVVSLSVRGNGQSSSGSGFVVDARGYIVTNNHVVSAAAGDGVILATFSNGRRVPATIVGRSPTYDLAVLAVEVAELPVATLGDSDALRVGDVVVAVGAPLGLTGTVTSGIISSLERPVATSDAGEASYISAVQTDAAINPGNSGGPLVDGRGRVVGIATAIATLGDGTGSIGLGFAIPVNKAKTIVEQLIRDGEAEYPVVGVLLDLTYRGPGARVQPDSAPGDAVTPGGPADKAGLKPGDLVTAVDGKPVASPEDFVVQVRSRVPGDVVTVSVRRGSERFTTEVTLGATVG